MKSLISRILHKVVATYIVLGCSLFIAVALTNTSSPLEPLIPTVITFVAVFLFMGAMLLIWRREVYWTPRKKIATLLLTLLALIIAPVYLFSENPFLFSLLITMPMLLFLAWSPARNACEQIMQEKDLGVNIRLYNKTVSRLMLSLALWGPATIAVIVFAYYLETDIYIATLISCLITATLWTVMWHPTIRWTISRKFFTLLAIILAGLAETSLLIFLVLNATYIGNYPLGILGLLAYIILISLTTAALWAVIWHSATRWTISRKIFIFLTIMLAGLAFIIPLILLILDASYIDDYPLGIIGLLAFIILTSLFWQNTSAERRRERDNAKLYKNFNATPYCAECGFNLTGLKTLRCPECGRQYTLAQIIYENVRMRDLDMQLNME